MANTTYLRNDVENCVRQELTKEFGVSFKPLDFPLVTGGRHEFDAVSEDGRIVGAIKSASGKTAGGRVPAGKIKDAEAELYYLTLVLAPTRMLVLTNPEFYEIMSTRLRGRLAPGLTLKLVVLPEEIQQRVTNVQKTASDEVSSKLG